MQQDIERYCVGELFRMYDAHRRTADILFDLAARTRQPLLATTLREQVAANTWCMEQLELCFEMLQTEPEEIPNAEVAVMVLEAGGEEDEVDEAVRDMMIAQSAIRLEHYALGNYTGLASWFRQLGKYGVGSVLDGIVKRLHMAEAHLEALQPSLSDLFQDPEQKYRPRQTPRPQERTVRSDLEGFGSGSWRRSR